MQSARALLAGSFPAPAPGEEFAPPGSGRPEPDGVGTAAFGEAAPGWSDPFGAFAVVPGSRWVGGFASTLLRCGSTGVFPTPGAGRPGEMPGTLGDPGAAVVPVAVALGA